MRGQKDGVEFFWAPVKNKEQPKSCMQAVSLKSKKINIKMIPSICPKHIVSGDPNPTWTHPDFTLSIFPTNNQNKSGIIGELKKLEDSSGNKAAWHSV
jgi:hypothetical protein